MKNFLKHILWISFLSILFPGCPVEYNVEYVAEIQSDTEWRAIINNEEIEGFGNQFLSIPLKQGQEEYELPVCVEVQKQSIRGYLKARVTVDGVSVLGSYDGEWAYTTADSGIVIACSQGSSD